MLLYFSAIQLYVDTRREWPYFEGQSAIQVAGDGWDNVTLGHSVVTRVGEALATAVLALIDLSSAGPHRDSAAAIWGIKQQVRGLKKLNTYVCVK